MFNIIVCVKQVPNTDKVKFDWSKGKLIRDNIENTMNLDDFHAIEMALQIKEKYNARVTTITLGPPQAKEVLREAYAMGVDDCILISDPAFAGSDTLITSKILYRAISKLGKFHFILTGFETIDGNTSQVHYQLSEFFEIPHLTQVKNIELNDNEIIAERLFGHEYQKIRANLPVIIACNRETNKKRHPRLLDIKNCFDKPIKTMNLKDVGGKKEDYGLLGSPTITIEGEIFKHKRKKEVFEGDLDEKVEKLVKKLKKYGIIKI